MDITGVEEDFKASSDGKCTVADGGMVATAFPQATQAGVEMLKQGGNAVDAACAAAFALGVCEPQASGLGGQTMAILHINGQAIFLNGSGRVPSLGHLSQFKDNDQRTGYRGTTVPSTVAVLGHLNSRFGRLHWSNIIEPAIRIARDGYKITKLQHDLLIRELDNFFQVPSRSGAKYFLKGDKKPYSTGELFRQPQLADLLKHLADFGPEAFYTGMVAKKIDEDMRANNGFLRADDLAFIPWPVEQSPLRSTCGELTLLTSPPPSPGRILILIIKVLDLLQPALIGSSSQITAQFLVEIIKKALLEHKLNPIRPDLYNPATDPALNDKSLPKDIADSIINFVDPSFSTIMPDFQGGETTHLSVMDKDGNAAGLTQSINLVYGSKVAAEGLGFIYNNYLADSDTADPAHPHFLKPNGIPVSMVCPTIILRNERPWLVAGSPGSERIVSALAQFLFHVIYSGLPISEAMRMPRLHCSTEGKVSLESERFNPDV
ncbi:MAG: gamma-glutamyltransferase, partial [Chloroflexota bacterium]|nr:gamma-glutamyltransferase [Chloroflexota bacterium]